MAETTTSFSTIYKSFFSKITDDMYLELDKEQTEALQKELLLSSLFSFEFPRFDLENFDEDLETYNILLTREEINVLATYMVVEWIGQQLASVENVRMKYSGDDFKFSSQANHMKALLDLKEEYTAKAFKLQRLYKRRRKNSETGLMESTFGDIMGGSAL